MRKINIISKSGTKIELKFDKELFLTIPKIKLIDKKISKVKVENENLVINELSIKVEVTKKDSDNINNFLKQVKTAKKEEKIEEYKDLENKLTEIKYNKNPNDKLAKKYIDQANSIEFFKEDNLNEGLKIKKANLLDKAQNLCDHNYEITISRGASEGLNRRLTRKVICKKCNLQNLEIINE